MHELTRPRLGDTACGLLQGCFHDKAADPFANPAALVVLCPPVPLLTGPLMLVARDDLPANRSLARWRSPVRPRCSPPAPCSATGATRALPSTTRRRRGAGRP